METIYYAAPEQHEEELFWEFICSRQECWYNRHILKLPEVQWTPDEIIGIARFCNVYRELDRGTQFGVEEVLEKNRPSAELDIAHSVTYRLFNNIDTYLDIQALINDMYFGDMDAFTCIARLLDERLERKEKVFTGAYMCVSTPDYGYSTKGQNYAYHLLIIYQSICQTIGPLIASHNGTLKNVYDAFSNIRGVGPFNAYQFCLDLMYPLVKLDGNKVAKYADVNTWTQPGPGCTRGLAILGIKGPDSTQIRALRGLHFKHVHILHAMGFKWLRDSSGASYPLSLGNIENCFCEFAKWRRMKDGGHMKTKWSVKKDVWRPQYITLPCYGAWVEPENGREVIC